MIPIDNNERIRDAHHRVNLVSGMLVRHMQKTEIPESVVEQCITHISEVKNYLLMLHSVNIAEKINGSGYPQDVKVIRRKPIA